jgi:hypothetical protein
VRFSHLKLIDVKGLLSLLTLLTVLLAPLQAQTNAKEKKRYIRYAEFLEDTRVELSDGTQWLMDKGDCFPIHMYKDQQTRVILQLAGATFSTPLYRVQVVPERDEQRAVQAYRKMLDTYLKAKADMYKEDAVKKP